MYSGERTYRLCIILRTTDLRAPVSPLLHVLVAKINLDLGRPSAPGKGDGE